jgi:hypothetical protein
VLQRNLFAKFVTGFVIVGFVVMELLFFFVWCWPFNQYWAVPADNGKTKFRDVVLLLQLTRYQ